MNIDTLILSGGGPAGVAYTSIFQALYDKGILSPDLKGIKEIITTSIGIVMSFLILSNVDNRVIRGISTRYDIAGMLDLEDISIDGLLFDSGLYDTRGIRELFTTMIHRILQKDDITLQELYDKSHIKLSVKVFNITDKYYEFISHVTHPDLSLITLAEMTTAIPVLFKPILYQEKLYCDGGIKHGYPTGYEPSPNYLGIFLNAGCDIGTISLPIVQTLMNILQGNEPEFTLTERIINANTNTGLDFGIDEEKKQRVLRDAYNTTIEHIETYFI